MKPPTRLPLLILDCDGVLIRSEPANLAYYNHLFETFGMPVVAADDQARVRILHTASTPQVLERFVPDDRRDEVLAYASGVDFARFIPLLEAEPGWAEVLERRRSFDRAVVATNRGASARTVLDAVGLLEHLDDVVTIRDVARPKPAPDMLFEALGRQGLDAGDALYVGDSDLDARAATTAGVAFLGFRTPTQPSAIDPSEVEQFACRFAFGTSSGTLSIGPPLLR